VRSSDPDRSTEVPLLLPNRASGRAPSLEIYQQAIACLSEGDDSGAIALLEPLPQSQHTSATVLLCARAMIRSDRVRDARLWLANAALHARGDDNRATHLMLLGMVEGRESFFDMADELFQRALSCKPRHGERAEIEYERALAFFYSGSHEMAWERLRLIRPSDGVSHAQGLGLRGWLNCARDDHRSAQAAFSDALNALDETGSRDPSLRAPLLVGMAMTVAELEHQQVDRIIAQAEKVKWTAGLMRQRVQTMQYIGLSYRHDDRPHDAMRTFLAVAEMAPASGWAVIALAECAALSFELGELVSARGFVSYAGSLAEDIEWDTVFGEQRLALLILAEVFARSGEGDAAKQQLETYQRRAIARGTDHLYLGAKFTIYIEHIEALIAGALGDGRGAKAKLGRVHRAWSKLGHVWRARETLKDIERVDPKRAHKEFLAAADEVHRQSMVAGHVQTPALNRRRPATAGRREYYALRYNLSPRMAEILNLVVEGRTNTEISAAVNLSVRTVKNKICELYRVTGVQHRGPMSRSELIVRCNSPAETLLGANMVDDVADREA
jgi:DNA-binding CsgD family transcriptional regulator